MKAGALFFFSFLVCQAFAQQFSLRNYKAVDGLPQSQVSAMVEDQNGYLWIGTIGGGLARFDGREFKVYTTLDGLLSNKITSLMFDSNQNLWIVHPRGFTKYDGHTFKKIHSPSNAKFVWNLAQISDTIFFQVGIRRTIGKIFEDSILVWDKPFIPGKRIYFSLRTSTGTLCYYLSDSSFHLISPKGIQDRISFKGVFNTVRSMVNYCHDILLDTDQGFYIFNFGKKKLIPAGFVIKDHIVAYDSMAKIFWVEKDNALWKQPADANKTPEKVIGDISIMQILFDREGNVWIATSGNGLYKYGILDFNKCVSDKLGSVMAIAVDKSGATWLGSRTLLKIKKGKVTKYPLNIGNSSDIVNIKVNKRGDLWVASLSG